MRVCGKIFKYHKTAKWPDHGLKTNLIKISVNEINEKGRDTKEDSFENLWIALVGK